MQGGRKRVSGVDREAGESGLRPGGELNLPSWGVWGGGSLPSLPSNQALGMELSLHRAPIRGQFLCNT